MRGPCTRPGARSTSMTASSGTGGRDDARLVVPVHPGQVDRPTDVVAEVAVLLEEPRDVTRPVRVQGEVVQHHHHGSGSTHRAASTTSASWLR